MNNKENKMGTHKVLPLLLSMSLPPTISMMTSSLYNIVDSIFVARLGNEALTAVSLAFPIQILCNRVRCWGKLLCGKKTWREKF